MKESELKQILTTPVMDQDMDQKVTDTILCHEADSDINFCRNGWIRAGYRLSNRALKFSISKIATVIFILAIVGAGTAWAAGFFVKSYPSEIKVITENELEDMEKVSYNQENTIKKSFGAGNKLISMPRDAEGNLLEINEEGYMILEGGTKIIAPYIPDPDRHEKARKSGEEAFTEAGFPDLIPAYLYDNYLLGESGFVYTAGTYENDVPYQEIVVEFVSDAYDTGDFLKENIWITFVPSETSVKDVVNIHVRDDSNCIISNYTTKGGIICSMFEEPDRNAIRAHISFDSEAIGNGNMMIEFIGIGMDKIREILDTIPLSEDNVDPLTTE